MAVSFADYKSQMDQLRKEQLELVSALEETTRNLQDARQLVGCLVKKLRETMTEKEIDFMLENELGTIGKISA